MEGIPTKQALLELEWTGFNNDWRVADEGVEGTGGGGREGVCMLVADLFSELRARGPGPLEGMANSKSPVAHKMGVSSRGGQGERALKRRWKSQNTIGTHPLSTSSTWWRLHLGGTGSWRTRKVWMRIQKCLVNA